MHLRVGLATCLLAVPLLAATPQKTETEVKPLEFPKDVQSKQIQDQQANEEWATADHLEVEFKGVRIEGSVLWASAMVTNEAGQPFVLIVWPYGGDFPYGGNNPFRIAFAPSATEIVTYSGELFPPGPPSPMRIVIPPKSRVRFVAEIELTRYDYDGSPQVEIDWAFHYFDGPHPEGKATIRLPAR